MAISQGKSTRGLSGKRNISMRGKRKFELGRDPAETRIGDKKLRKIRTRGGNYKNRLAEGNVINIINPETNKAENAEIYNVIENKANPNYVRRNIITKRGYC